ncbi:MAG TPA: hypothetical protein VIK12_01710 [Pengzhenrongella sp.]
MLSKADYQRASLIDLLDDHAALLTRVVEEMPPGTRFSINDIRARLDAAGVPPGARGGLFAGACTARLIVASEFTVHGQTYPEYVPSTGESAHTARVRVYRRVDPS